MNAEPLRPGATGDLADRAVDLARLLICQALVLGTALQAQAGRMVLLLALRRPFEVARAVVQLVPVDVVHRVTGRGLGWQESVSDQGVNRNPLVCSRASGQAHLKVVAFEHQLQQAHRRMSTALLAALRAAAHVSLPVIAGCDTPDITEVRHLIYPFPIRDSSPLFFHSDRVTLIR